MATAWVCTERVAAYGTPSYDGAVGIEHAGSGAVA
jgi:hypothetical protein